VVESEKYSTSRPDLLSFEIVSDDMMMTMDFREDRVRIISGKDGKVASAPHIG
jgi:hypothetical protein